MRKRKLFHDGSACRTLSRIGFQKFQSCRSRTEKPFAYNRRTVGKAAFLRAFKLSVINRNDRAGRILSALCHYACMSNCGYRRKCLAAKSERHNRRKILCRLYFARSMTPYADHCVLSRHAFAVVGYTHKSYSAVFYLGGYRLCSGVY